MARKIPLSELKKHFPKDITTDLLTRQFLQFATDRYPSADKAKQNVNTILARSGIKDPLPLCHARIIILSLYRDLVRAVDPDFVYTSSKHKEEVYAAIIEALEGLEEELIELEEEAVEEELFEEGEEEELEL